MENQDLLTQQSFNVESILKDALQEELQKHVIHISAECT